MIELEDVNKDFYCDICEKEFKNRGSLSAHKRWHNPEFRERMTKINRESHNRPEYRKKMSRIRKETWNKPGFRENHSGENSNVYKGDNIGVPMIHFRAHIADPKPKDGVCELCGNVTDKFGKNKLFHSNKDHSYNLPIVSDEWWWIHKSCHEKYDKKERNKLKNE